VAVGVVAEAGCFSFDVPAVGVMAAAVVVAVAAVDEAFDLADDDDDAVEVECFLGLVGAGVVDLW